MKSNQLTLIIILSAYPQSLRSPHLYSLYTDVGLFFFSFFPRTLPAINSFPLALAVNKKNSPRFIFICNNSNTYKYNSFTRTLRPRSHWEARSISDRSGLYTSWMWTFALFWDRSGIDPTWIASGGGLRSVQDRSTLFRAEWERKHVLKAIQLSSLPSLRVT